MKCSRRARKILRVRSLWCRAAEMWHNTRLKNKLVRRQASYPFGFERVHYDEKGISREKLAFVMDLKNVRRGRIFGIRRQVQRYGVSRRLIGSSITIHFGTSRPNAPFRARPRTKLTQRTRTTCSRMASMSFRKARTCRQRWRGCIVFSQAGILYGPGKAAKRGGVATIRAGDGAE
jgi:hypothetical protein